MASGEVPRSIKATLYIDGKPAEASIKNVRQVARTLEREINQMEIGTSKFNAKMKEVSANKKYLKELTAEVNGVGGAFAKIREELGSFGSLAVGFLGLQFISGQISNVISGNAKLSDSLADIRRVTGMTEAGVMFLDASLGKLSTRTSKSGLREIAIIAGKLGVAKTDILGFVESVDKLTVALGDELGNADKVTTELGKILNVFEGEVNGDNILRLGNAMVKLANDGVATAGFIADFTQRVSGIATAAGLSLGATIGLGAGLEEMGARSESSGTALQKLLMSIAKDLPAAAALAKTPVKEFQELFAKKPEEALLRFTAGLVKNKGAFDQIVVGLDEANETGSRVVNTITILGNKTEFFTDKILDANVALQGYSEINEAFKLKNETLGGQVDMLGKAFNKLTVNKTLIDLVTKLVIATVNLVNWLDRNATAIKNVTKAIIVAVIAWTTYTVVMAIANAEKKLWIKSLITAQALETLSILRMTSWGLITSLLTLNFTKARQELKLLLAVANSSGWGILIAGLVAAAAAIYMYSGSMTTASKIQGDFNNITVEAQKAAQKEADQLKRLDEIRLNENTTQKQKIAALEEIKRLYPSILKGLTDEEALHEKGSAAIRNYVKEIESKTTAEAAFAAQSALRQRNIDLENKLPGAVEMGLGERVINFFTNVGYNKAIEKKRIDEIAENKKRIIEISKNYAAEMLKYDTKEDTDKAITILPTAEEIKAAADAAETLRKQIIADEKKLIEELNQIGVDLTKDILEGYDKEVYAAGVKYQKLTELAHGNKKLLALIYKQEAAEIEQISQKFKEKALADAKKAYDEMLVETEKFKEKMFNLNNSDEKNQILELANKYESDQIQNYKSHEAKQLTDAEFAKAELDLQTKLQKDIEAVKTKSRKVITDEEKAKRKEEKELIIDSAKLVSDSVFSIIQSNEQAKSQAVLDNINKLRERELSNRNLTEAQKKKINDKYDTLEKNEKLKAWKADQKAALLQAVINGALSVVKAMPNLPLAIIAGVTAATQIAVITAQKPPKFAAGGLTSNDPAGFVSSPTLFSNSSSGRQFEAGEKGTEWIAPNWMVTDPRYSGMINSLEVARREKRSFGIGGLTGVTGGNSSNTVNNISDNKNLEYLMVQMIEAQNRANDKEIIFSHKTFEEQNAIRIKAINGAKA